VLDARSLAVHQAAGTHDLASKHFDNGLMAQTDSSTGMLPAKARIISIDIPASYGVPGPGRCTGVMGQLARGIGVIASLRYTDVSTQHQNACTRL